MYYTGKKATDYDAKRKNDPKRKFELATVKKLLDSIEIKSAIDAPVGTGAFLSLLPEKTTGYDISLDMLDIARKTSKAKLVILDILDIDFPTMADLVLSIRFLNLLDNARFLVALDRLLHGARKYAIFTLRTAKSEIKLGRVTVHKEQDALDAISAADFEVISRDKYTDDTPGDYEIFLCKRSKTRRKRDNHITDNDTEPDTTDRTVYTVSPDAKPASVFMDGNETDTDRTPARGYSVVPARVVCASCARK